MNTNDQVYQKIRRVAREVLTGQRPDNTRDSTHYHANNATYDQRSWATGKRPAIIIGAHHFYNTIA